jgi:cytochrome b pre-mRNA-processing protein 3
MLGHARERVGIRRARVRRLAFLLAVTTAIAAWFWLAGAEQRALSELPLGDRRDIYARELANLRALCAPPANSDLSERCRQQAEFVLEFPECDTACQELAGPLRSPR